MKYTFKNGKMYCRHGVILHGVSCATCERAQPDITIETAPPGANDMYDWTAVDTAKVKSAMDAASTRTQRSHPQGGAFGPDMADATAHAFSGWDTGRHKSHAYEFVVSREEAERMGIVIDPPYRWEHRSDGRARPEHVNCRSTMHAYFADGYEAPPESGHDYHPSSYVCRKCGTGMNAEREGRSPRCGFEVIVSPDDTRGRDAKVARGAV